MAKQPSLFAQQAKSKMIGQALAQAQAAAPKKKMSDPFHFVAQAAKWWGGGMPIGGRPALGVLPKDYGAADAATLKSDSAAASMVANEKSYTMSHSHDVTDVTDNSGQSVQAAQQFLRSQGYNISVDGIMGPQTKAALADWHKGADGRNPKMFNTTQGGTGSGAGTGTNGAPSSGLSHTSLEGPPSNTAGGTTKAPYQVSNVNTNTYSNIPESLAKSGATIFDPLSVAKSMAGAQYDPQIMLAKLQQLQQGRDAAQHTTDIGSWYKQVAGSLKSATAADKNLGTDAANTITNATSGLLSSLGGAANPAAGTLSAAGLSAASTQAQMGEAQNQYNTNMAPILDTQAADAKSRQGALDSQNATNLAAQLMSLMSQKGNAQANFQTQVQQENNQTQQQQLTNLLGIKQANSQGAQQNFQNSATVEELRQAAALNNAEVGYYKTTSNPGGFVNWDRLNAAQKTQLIDKAMSSVLGPDGSLLGNRNQAGQNARTYLSGLGYTNALPTGADPNVQSQISAMLQTALNRAQGITTAKTAALAKANS